MENLEKKFWRGNPPHLKSSMTEPPPIYLFKLLTFVAVAAGVVCGSLWLCFYCAYTNIPPTPPNALKTQKNGQKRVFSATRTTATRATCAYGYILMIFDYKNIVQRKIVQF